MNSIVTNEDMRLLKSCFPYTAPASLPISYFLDGRLKRGIGDEFSPKAETSILNEHLLHHIIYGKNTDGLEIRAEILEYLDYPVLEFLAFFTNGGDCDTPVLSDIKIFDDEFACAKPVLSHGNGDTLKEDGYEWIHEDINREITKSPSDGTSMNGAFPYMRVTGEEWSMNLAVGWPAAWKTSFVPAKNGFRVSVGQKRMHTRLHPGETLRTPRATFMLYTGDETRGINLWRRWYFDHILPRPNGRNLQPKVCMHVFRADGHPEFTGATEENQLRGIDDYLDKGVHPDVWWIDAGWYPCDYEWTHTGTWEPDKKRFPNGLTPIGKKCLKTEMDFLLWFEPERVRPGTKIAKEHPEWLLHTENEDGSENINSLLNLGNKECLLAITDIADSIIKESGVTIYRQDFNFDPAPYWAANEAVDRIGVIENFHVQGYLQYWDTLLERNPGLLIDSCASGGRRNDLETMRRAVPMHYTDVGYGNHPVKQKQHYLMFMWIPYFRAHNMNWLNPETGEYGKTDFPPDRYSYYCAMTPALTDMLGHNADDDAFALARKMHPIWRKAASLMLSSDYYPLTRCRKSAEDFYAVQFHNPDDECGFIEIISNHKNPSETYTARLEALNPGSVYAFINAETGKSFAFTGSVLADGIPFTLSPKDAEIYFYHKVV